MMGTGISVVVPTFQRRASVARLLRSLDQQTLPPGEVIVVIDGSADGTRELVESLGPASYPQHALWQPNRGRASARNAGIRAASGEILVLLDDDMEPAPGCLAAHARAHEGAARRGVLGAVPIVVGTDTPPTVAYIGTKFNAHLDRLAQPGCPITFRDFYTGNFSIRREVLLQIGLLDESYTLYGNEDCELAIRLLAGGVELVYDARALASQHYEKTFAALARDTREKGWTALLCARQHPRDVTTLERSGPASRAWRLLRTLLIMLTRHVPAIPDGVTALVGWLERRAPRRMHAGYRLALDYFYWSGIDAARRQASRDAGGEGLSLAGARMRRG
jgi:GT2 family glycosyltransferase